MSTLPEFRIHPLGEDDLDKIIADAGGKRAHTDASRRPNPGADYLLGDSLIELKALDEEGLTKPERQDRLAALFVENEPNRPVIVLDRNRLPETDQRRYDRIVEGPIKTLVAKAKSQLRQSKSEIPDASSTILFVVNNGYTSLDYESLTRLVAHRVRNDTEVIDGIVVAGCYFYSDGFDSYLFWPIEYVPIRADRQFGSYDALQRAWNRYSEEFMTGLIAGGFVNFGEKGPVVDTSFDSRGVTFVKPAPAMGKASDFYAQGRPRTNSTGLKACPPVAITFPALSREEWDRFRGAFASAQWLGASFEAWQADRAEAASVGTALRPFVPVAISFDGWREWQQGRPAGDARKSLGEFATFLFDAQVRDLVRAARERHPSSIVPHRYVLVATEVIGQDMANDVSHIAVVHEKIDGTSAVRPLVENARIFHEHAVALAAAYVIVERLGSILWQKDLRYAWI